MTLMQRIFPFLKKAPPLANEAARSTSEIGRRPTPENQVKYLFRTMWVDPDVREAIIDIRNMDRVDGRTKRIHTRIARDTIKGGIVLQQSEDSAVLTREWDNFVRRLQLNRVEKLKSDARGLIMEGTLPLQWVLDEQRNVVAGVRMPAETILPMVDQSGRFVDVRKAYRQVDYLTGTALAEFALWQLCVARFDPDNYDDLGSFGRPFLDASRGPWKKLLMTEEDLVIRRRTRAPLRLAHTLEGATSEDLEKYRAGVEKDQYEITTDYYLNKKGGVAPIQGDSNLDQIADITHLLDTFFSGSPLPKGMMGYTDGMARDILEDLKRDYYDEIDVIQDTLSYCYDEGFRLQLLLRGMNPDDLGYKITYAERRTETPNQTTDRALKLKALGMPAGMVWEELGYDPAYVRERAKYEAKLTDPYPTDDDDDEDGAGKPKIKITPGNGRKGESGTSVGNG